MFQPTLRPSSGYFVLTLWKTTSGSMLTFHHLLGKVCAEWVEHIIYYIVIVVLVFKSLAWWRGVDGRGVPSGVIAPVVAGLGVVYTSVLCAGLLVLSAHTLPSRW